MYNGVVHSLCVHVCVERALLVHVMYPVLPLVLQVAIKIIPKSKVFGWSKVCCCVTVKQGDTFDWAYRQMPFTFSFAAMESD